MKGPNTVLAVMPLTLFQSTHSVAFCTTYDPKYLSSLNSCCTLSVCPVTNQYFGMKNTCVRFLSDITSSTPHLTHLRQTRKELQSSSLNKDTDSQTADQNHLQTKQTTSSEQVQLQERETASTCGRSTR